MTLHTNILDDARRALLHEFVFLREHGFYLAGGTALALQIGHRDSIDFDFFRGAPIDDTTSLFESIAASLDTHTITKIQEERNTLGILIDNTVHMSCMTFPYMLTRDLVQSEHLDLASIEDIGCMKLNAITGRGAWKDYVDLYFITNIVPLETLIEHLRKKMPNLDPLLVLKSLVYFEDLPEEPILYKVDSIDRKKIEAALVDRVRAVS